MKEIQPKRRRAGFSHGWIDRKFGRKALAAVVASQAARGLVVDGQVDPQAARALRIKLERA